MVKKTLRKEVLILVLALPACMRKSPHTSAGSLMSPVVRLEQAHDIRQQEAKLVDIPVPLGAQPLSVDIHQTSSSFMLVYTSTMSQKDILTFYAHEMERLGWRANAQFSAHESLVYFEKPGRFMALSLRPTVTAWRSSAVMLVITSGKKERGNAG